MIDVKIEASWKKALSDQFDKPYFKTLTEFIRKEYQQSTIYPEAKNIFRAFDATPFDKVKVVILGQDPYHGEGQANGLCFSVAPNRVLPPSLRNIYKERSTDLDLEDRSNGDLSDWAAQGVMLLNATLTVKAHEAGSHQKKGWERFTDAAINALAESQKNLVFMLWGAYAQKKGDTIDPKNHQILKAPHPSPLSAHRGFLGCRHFSSANDYLQAAGKSPIRW